MKFFFPGLVQQKFRWTVLFVMLSHLCSSAWADEKATLFKQLIDESLPVTEREAIIQKHPEQAVNLLKGMVADFPVESAEEYRRIPWIWRVTIAAGKRNDAAQIKELLEVSVPRFGEPLRDWEAVVIGGGLINGISQLNLWPGKRIQEIIGGDENLRKRWERALDLSAEMAENEKVPFGTRYDALRMIALQTWEKRGAQLSKYLKSTAHPEMQQGAVSGLADLNSPAATKALLRHWEDLTVSNRRLAFDALLRDVDRATKLVEAIERKQVNLGTLSQDQITKLKQVEGAGLREKVAGILEAGTN